MEVGSVFFTAQLNRDPFDRAMRKLQQDWAKVTTLKATQVIEQTIKPKTIPDTVKPVKSQQPITRKASSESIKSQQIQVIRVDDSEIDKAIARIDSLRQNISDNPIEIKFSVFKGADREFDAFVVDTHKGLKSINDHLDIKEKHFKRVFRIARDEARALNQEIAKEQSISTGRERSGIVNNYSQHIKISVQTGKISSEIAGIAKEVGGDIKQSSKDIVSAINKLRPSLLSRVVSTVTKPIAAVGSFVGSGLSGILGSVLGVFRKSIETILYGLTQGVSINITKKFSKGIESFLEDQLSSLIGSLELGGEGVSRRVKIGAQNIINDVNLFFESIEVIAKRLGVSKFPRLKIASIDLGKAFELDLDDVNLEKENARIAKAKKRQAKKASVNDYQSNLKLSATEYYDASEQYVEAVNKEEQVKSKIKASDIKKQDLDRFQEKAVVRQQVIQSESISPEKLIQTRESTVGNIADLERKQQEIKKQIKELDRVRKQSEILVADGNTPEQERLSALRNLKAVPGQKNTLEASIQLIESQLREQKNNLKRINNYFAYTNTESQLTQNRQTYNQYQSVITEIDKQIKDFQSIAQRLTENLSNKENTSDQKTKILSQIKSVESKLAVLYADRAKSVQGRNNAVVRDQYLTKIQSTSQAESLFKDESLLRQVGTLKTEKQDEQGALKALIGQKIDVAERLKLSFGSAATDEEKTRIAKEYQSTLSFIKNAQGLLIDIEKKLEALNTKEKEISSRVVKKRGATGIFSLKALQENLSANEQSLLTAEGQKEEISKRKKLTETQIRSFSGQLNNAGEDQKPVINKEIEKLQKRLVNIDGLLKSVDEKIAEKIKAKNDLLEKIAIRKAGDIERGDLPRSIQTIAKEISDLEKHQGDLLSEGKQIIQQKESRKSAFQETQSKLKSVVALSKQQAKIDVIVSKILSDWGVDPSKINIPSVKKSSASSQLFGAYGIYDPHGNQLHLNPKDYDTLVSDTATIEEKLKSYYTLVHELAHALDFEFGSKEGIQTFLGAKQFKKVEISQDEMENRLPSTIDPRGGLSLQEFADLYKEKVKEFELSAESQARRYMKEKFPEYFQESTAHHQEQQAIEPALTIPEQIAESGSSKIAPYVNKAVDSVGDAITHIVYQFNKKLEQFAVDRINAVLGHVPGHPGMIDIGKRINSLSDLTSRDYLQLAGKGLGDVRHGINAGVSGVFPAIRGAYGVAKGAENFALGFIPGGHAIKGVVQNTVLPAAAFGVASNLLPGGGAIAHGMGSIAHGAIEPLVNGLGSQMSTTLVSGITEALSGAPFGAQIAGAVGGAIQSAIGGGFAALGSGAAEVGTAIVGGKLLLGGGQAAGSALLNTENKANVKALPESTQKLQKQTELHLEVAQENLAEVQAQINNNLKLVAERASKISASFKGASEKLKLQGTKKQIKSLPPSKIQEQVDQIQVYRQSIVNATSHAIVEVDELLSTLEPQQRLNSPLSTLKSNLVQNFKKAVETNPVKLLQKQGVSEDVIKTINVQAVSIPDQSLLGKAKTTDVSAQLNVKPIAKKAGAETVTGFEQGIKAEIAQLAEVVLEIPVTAKKVIQEGLDIHSPSGVTKRIGEDVDRGFVLGVKEGLPNIKKVMSDVGSAMEEGIDKRIERHSPPEVFVRIGKSIPEALKIGIDKTKGLLQGSINNVVNVLSSVASVDVHPNVELAISTSNIDDTSLPTVGVKSIQKITDSGILSDIPTVNIAEKGIKGISSQDVISEFTYQKRLEALQLSVVKNRKEHERELMRGTRTQFKPLPLPDPKTIKMGSGKIFPQIPDPWQDNEKTLLNRKIEWLKRYRVYLQKLNKQSQLTQSEIKELVQEYNLLRKQKSELSQANNISLPSPTVEQAGKPAHKKFVPLKAPSSEQIVAKQKEQEEYYLSLQSGVSKQNRRKLSPHEIDQAMSKLESNIVAKSKPLTSNVERYSAINEILKSINNNADAAMQAIEKMFSIREGNIDEVIASIAKSLEEGKITAEQAKEAIDNVLNARRKDLSVASSFEDTVKSIKELTQVAVVSDDEIKQLQGKGLPVDRINGIEQLIAKNKKLLSESQKLLDSPDLVGGQKIVRADLVEQLKKYEIEIKNIEKLLNHARASANRADQALEQLEHPTILSQTKQALEGFVDYIDSKLGKVGLSISGIVAAIGGFYVFQQIDQYLLDFARSLFEVGLQAEQIKISLDFAIATDANQKLIELKATADRLGVSFLTLADGYQKFAATTVGTSLESQTDRIYTQIQSGFAVRGLPKEQQDRAQVAISQIASKGVVQGEELRGQLSEAVPGAIQTAARAYGKSVQEFLKQVETGTVLAEEFLPKFAKQIEKESRSSLDSLDKSTTAAINRFKNQWESLQILFGKPILDVSRIGLNAATAGLKALTVILQVGSTVLTGFLVKLGVQAAIAAVNYARGMELATLRTLLFSKAVVTVVSTLAKFAASLALFYALGKAFELVSTIIWQGTESSKDSLDKLKASYLEIAKTIKNNPIEITVKNPEPSGIMKTLSFINADRARAVQALKQHKEALDYSELSLIKVSSPQGSEPAAIDPKNLAEAQKVIADFDNQIAEAKVYEGMAISKEDLKKAQEYQGIIADITKRRETYIEFKLKGVELLIEQKDTIQNIIQENERILKESRAGNIVLSANTNLTEEQARQGVIDQIGVAKRKLEEIKKVEELYGRTVQGTNAEYRKTLSLLNDIDKRIANIDFAYQEGLLKTSNEVKQDFLKGNIWQVDIDLNVKKEQLNLLKTAQADIQKEVNEAGKILSSKLTESVDKQLSAIFEKQLKGKSFSSGLYDGNISPEVIDNILQNYEKETTKPLSDVLQSALESAKKQLTLQRQNNQKQGEILDTQIDINNTTFERAKLARQAALEEKLSKRNVELLTKYPGGGRAYNVEQAQAELERQELQLQELYKQRDANIGNPDEVRSQIAQTNTAIAQAKANLIKSEYDLAVAYRELAIKRRLTSADIAVIKEDPFGGVVASYKSAKNEVNRQNERLAEAYKKLAKNPSDPIDIESEIEDIKLAKAQADANFIAQTKNYQDAFRSLALDKDLGASRRSLLAQFPSQGGLFNLKEAELRVADAVKRWRVALDNLAKYPDNPEFDRAVLDTENALAEAQANLISQQRNWQRSLYDFRKSLEDFYISSVREVRGLQESYDDLMRGLNRSLQEAQNALNTSQRQLRVQQLKVNLNEGLTFDNSIAKQFFDFIVDFQDQLNAIADEADGLKLRDFDIQEQLIQGQRNIRNIQEQIFDAERNRLSQIEQLRRQEEDLFGSRKALLEELNKTFEIENEARQKQVESINELTGAFDNLIKNGFNNAQIPTYTETNGYRDPNFVPTRVIQGEFSEIPQPKPITYKKAPIIQQGQYLGTSEYDPMDNRQKRYLWEQQNPGRTWNGETPTGMPSPIPQQPTIPNQSVNLQPQQAAITPQNITLNLSGKEQLITNWAKNLGFTPSAIAATLGNFRQEGTDNGVVFNPYAYNESSGAYGIAQWLGNRKTALLNQYPKTGSESTDLQNQLKFAQSELTQTQLNILRSANTIDEAMRAWNGFERWSGWQKGRGGAEAGNRYNYAEDYYRRISPQSSTNSNLYAQIGMSDMGDYEQIAPVQDVVDKLPEIPKPDFNEAKRLLNDRNLLDIQRQQNDEQANQLKLINAQQQGRRQLINLSRNAYFQSLQTAQSVRSQQISTEDLLMNSKGYLTVQEQVYKVGRDILKTYDDQIISLKDQKRAIQEQVDAWTPERVAEYRDALIQEGLSAEQVNQAIAQANEAIAILQRQLPALDQAITKTQGNRQQAVTTGQSREQERIDLDSFRTYSETKAGFLSQIAEGSDPITASLLNVEAATLRVNAAFAQQRYELKDLKDAGKITAVQFDELTGALNKAEQVQLDKAFLENNVFAREFATQLKGIFTNATSVEDALRNLALSVLDLAATWAANQIILSLFGGLFGGIGGGGIGGGIARGVTGAFKDGGTVGIKNFTDGGKVEPVDVANFAGGGSVLGLGLGVIEAMKREGPGATPIVAQKDEEIVSNKNGESKFLRYLKRSGRWAQMRKEYQENGYERTPINNYRGGGTVGNVANSSMVNRGGNSGQPTIVNNSYQTHIEVKAQDANSFRKSKAQIEQEQRISQERANRNR